MQTFRIRAVAPNPSQGILLYYMKSESLESALAEARKIFGDRLRGVSHAKGTPQAPAIQWVGKNS